MGAPTGLRTSEVCSADSVGIVTQAYSLRKSRSVQRGGRQGIAHSVTSTANYQTPAFTIPCAYLGSSYLPDAFASRSSSLRLRSTPHRYPPRPPSLRTTRWHGMATAIRLDAHAWATARAALGLSIRAAMSE